MFDWLKKLSKRSIENPSVPLSQAYDYLVDNPSASGVAVNGKSVLGHPAVWRGVRLISGHVGKIPLCVYRKVKDGGREPATNHPSYKLLKKQASDTVTAFQFKKTLTSHALLWGNGYAFIERNGAGQPIGFHILDPEHTYPVRENGVVSYATTLDGVLIRLPFADVLHIKGLCHDGLYGHSLLHVMRDALGHGLTLQRFGSYYFKNAGKPSVVIELPPNIGKDAEKIERFRQMWGSAHQGIHNAARPALMMAGSKLTPLSFSNEDGQFLQSREFDLKMMADILCIPPHKLSATYNTSYNSLESENQAWLADCLDEWLVEWETECEMKLLSEAEKSSDKAFIEFNRKQLIQIDAKTETDLLIAELNNGLISWQEARGKINLPTDKTDADEWRRPANITVEGQEPPQAPAQQPQPDQAPDGAEKPSEPPQGASEGNGDTARALKLVTVERLLKRLANSTKTPLTHIEVFREALPGCVPDWPEDFLASISDEWESVLPEQRAKIVDRFNPETLIEEIWKSEETPQDK